MVWSPNRSRPPRLEWQAGDSPSADSHGQQSRLRSLLNADSLDDLVRVAFEEIAPTSGVARLCVVGWNAHQLGPWAVFPHTPEDRVLSTSFEDRLMAIHHDLPLDASDDSLAGYASSLGFDGMAIVPWRRHLVFDVLWSYAEPSLARIDPRQDNTWPDLELALGVFARFDQLRELSHIDTLTNVFNRRYFNLRLIEEVARAERFGRTLMLGICDLDQFKSLNDEHGHQAGDVVLRYLAQTLRRSLRAIDIISRLGGDEFAVLMPDTTADECSLLANRLRTAVASGGFTLGGKDSGGFSLDLRISIGGAVFPKDAQRPERLLWCADMALLEAKRRGGDRFLLFDPAIVQRGSAL